MKNWPVVVMAIALGLGFGLGSTVRERLAQDELFLPAEFAARQERMERIGKREALAPKRAKLELLDGSKYDFGSMERMSKKSHTFRIRSVGSVPLTLKVNRTSCKCSVSSISGETFAPGQTADIEVEWTGQQAAADFQQTVEVRTNDPDHEFLLLMVSGYVTETIRALPEELVVGRFAAESGGQVEFQLFAFRSPRIEILETTYEDPETADRMDLTFESMPEEDYQLEKGATCGLKGRLTLKSGLPLGPLNQTIQLRARADKEVTIFLPVKGRVISDITIASTSMFEANQNVLNFGPLQRTESAKAVLHVYVKGEHRHETTFSVGKTDPEGYLNVTVGPREELSNGKTFRYPVTIEIPAGLPPINRLGADYAKYGRVVLETTNPATKEVPINVRFAVDE